MLDLEPALMRTFLAVVETGRLTEAGQQVGRTQPAVWHQMKRLQDMVGKPLFGPNRRNLTLTADGEILLHYARAVLLLADEARLKLNGPQVEGRVVLGTPDLYAAHLLPDILGNFVRSHPGIDIELRCQRSVSLQEAIQSSEIDIALVTRQPGYRGGVNVRREPMVWVADLDSELETKPVLPLAVLPEGSVYREHALAALARGKRAWQIISVSDSLAGLQAAIFSGLAVAVFPSCAVTPGMRRLGTRDGLPDLPVLDLALLRRTAELPPAANHLAEYLEAEIGDINAYRHRASVRP